MSDLSNKKEIGAFLHCGLCIDEYRDLVGKGELKGISAGDYQQLEIGWTKPGLQVWCKRHNCNVIHLDFQGQKHPANVSRFVEPIKKAPN